MHTRLAIGLVLCVFAACGDDGGGSTADAGPGLDGRAGLCAGQPCLLAIETTGDWAQVADDSTERCDLDQVTKYLTPATTGAALQQTVYQDVKVHRFHLEFMRAVLGDCFGGLPTDTYYALVQRRATREYWAGTIFRVTDGVATVGYGFDVIIDPTEQTEQLAEAEIQAIGDQLAETFGLELGYAPISAGAIERARDFTALTFPVHLPRACPGKSCDDPAANCLTVPQGARTCGVFAEGRTIEQEHARLVELDFIAGAWDLPATDATVPMTLISGGELGPDRVAVTSAGEGSMLVEDQGDWIRYTYTQQLEAGSDVIDVRWELSLQDGAGQQVTLEEPWISEMLYMFGTINDSQQYEDRLDLASCTYEGLEEFHATASLAGGDGFTLEVRHRLPFAGSGPMNIVGADVTLGGQNVVVDDYFRLVYAGEHHNWNNQFWVLFGAPVQYDGHPVYGLWVDEAAHTCCPVDGIYTLDENLQQLDTLTVLDYSFAQQ